MDLIKLLILGMLVMHGIGHVTGFLTAWTKIPMGFRDNPWIFSKSVRLGSPIGKVVGLIWLVAMISFLVAAFGLFTNQAYWMDFAVVAAICSLMVILPWPNTVVPGALYGGTLANLFILVMAFGPWREYFLALSR
jgi:hypothetical protein